MGIAEGFAGNQLREWFRKDPALGHLQATEVERLQDSVHQLLVFRSLKHGDNVEINCLVDMGTTDAIPDSPEAAPRPFEMTT